VQDASSGADEGRPFGLVCVERKTTPHFLATGSRFRVEDEIVNLPPEVRRLLGLQPGETVGFVPA
jgi:hypothetical protein